MQPARLTGGVLPAARPESSRPIHETPGPKGPQVARRLDLADFRLIGGSPGSARSHRID
jgi:hypothetical protein